MRWRKLAPGYSVLHCQAVSLLSRQPGALGGQVLPSLTATSGSDFAEMVAIGEQPFIASRSVSQHAATHQVADCLLGNTHQIAESTLLHRTAQIRNHYNPLGNAS
ncbi:hypothetical protein A9K70_12925 [Stenotrophomonas maltophilia]|nr:hypothetical protein A9K70_12925 [Stenotrophomonas maltophilia]